MYPPRTAYDTSVGRTFNINEVKKLLEIYLINVNYKPPVYEFINSDKFISVFITGQGLEKDLPLFNHPLSVVIRGGTTYLFTDVRTSVKLENLDNVLIDSARNKVNLNYEITRNLLSIMTMEHNVSEMKNLFKYSARIFTYWLSGVLARTLTLDLGEKNTLSVIVCAHYYAMNSVKEIKESDMDLLVHTCAKITGTMPKNIRPVLEKLDYSAVSIDTLTNNIKLGMSNIKTKHLTSSSMLNFINTSWFGPNSTEAIPMALEHLPTWLSILYITATERTFKRSVIADVVFNSSKKKDLKNFLLDFESILKERKSK